MGYQVQDTITNLAAGASDTFDVVFLISAGDANNSVLTDTATASANGTYSSASASTTVLNLLSTTTTLASSADPSTFGQTITLTVTVSNGGPGSPTGQVEFLDGENVLGTATLSDGQATFVTSALTVGDHALSAAYQGDAADAASTSGEVSENVQPIPAVTGLSPNSGSTVGGAYVEIDGSGFTGATGVRFGGVASYMYYQMGDGVIDAYAPAQSAGTVDVTVTTGSGTSALSSADQFTYVTPAPPPAPAVTGVSPPSGPMSGGAYVTIDGTNFTGAMSVSFGGVAAVYYDVMSSTEIMAEAPADTAGVVDIAVTTAGGTSATSAYDHFTYNPPPPTAANDSYTLLHDHALSVAAAGVLANDTSPGGPPLSAVLASMPQHGMIGLNADGAFVYTPNADYVGTDGFGYYAVAGGQESNEAGVLLTVTDQAPVITAPGNQSNTVGDDVVLAINASDPDGDALTYSAANLPTGLSIDPGSGFITGTVAVGADGTNPYSVTVTASDGPESASQTFSWTVSHFSIPNPGDQTNAVGDSVYVPTGGADPDGDALTFTASDLPPGLGIESDNGLITGTISDTAADGVPYAVTLTASDGTYNASQTFNWTVTHVFVVNPGDQQNADGDSVILPINAGDNYDAPVTVSATGLPTGLSVNDVGNIVGTISNDADTNSPYTVTVSATDGTYSDSQTFQWTVSRFVLNNPGDQTNNDGDVVSLSVAADDNLGDTLAYGAAGLPTGLSIDGGTGLISGTIAPAADAAGPYSVTVTASGGGSSDSQTFAWTVNNPVSVNPVGDQTNALGDTVSLTVSATTATGDALAYSAAGLPDGLSINATTGVISGTVANTASITTPYDVTVTANDGQIGASTYFVWTVSHLTLTNPGDQTNVSGDAVSLSLTASDNAGDGLTFQANGLPPGLTISSTTGLISGVIGLNADAGGPYATTVSVTGGGYTATQAFAWNVSRILITDPGTQNGTDNDVVSLQIVATDHNPDTLTYGETGLPTGLTINGNTGLISGTIAPTADIVGLYTVTVTAGDGSGDSANDTFFWSVTQLTLTSPGDQSNATLDPVSLPLTATGPSGVTLHYTESGLPGGLDIGDTTGVISGTIAATAAVQPYDVTVTVSDGSGASASQSFEWTVGTIYLANPGDQSYAEDQQVTLPIVARDHEAPLIISAEGLPDGLYVSQDGTEIMGTVDPSAVQDAPYVVTLQAVDGNGNTATVTFDVKVADYTVVFSPNPVITGYLIGADGKPAPLPNPVKVRAIVSDPDAAGNIALEPAGPGKDRIKLSQEQLTKGISGKLDTVTANVIGLSETPVPPAGQAPGDTTIVAKDGNDVKASVNVIVVVPTSIKANHVVQRVKGKDMGLNSDTSPARLYVPKDANGKTQVDLVTVYVTNVTMTVLDQFGDPLNRIYASAPVDELFTGPDKKPTWVSINQKMTTAGTYSDPVGPLIERQKTVGGKSVDDPEYVLQGSDEQKNWESGSAPYPPSPGPYSIPTLQVRVGGFKLTVFDREVLITKISNTEAKISVTDTNLSP